MRFKQEGCMKKTVKLKPEVVMDAFIMEFCSNLAELGCPRGEKDPDMWYRNMKGAQRLKVMKKLLVIMGRYFPNPPKQ